MPRAASSAVSPDPFDHGEATVRFVATPAEEARELCARVARHWDVGPIETVETHGRSSRAYSSTHRLRSAAGPLILRRGLLHEAAQQTAIERLARLLRERGLPLPETRATRAGSPFAEEAGAVYTLTSFLPGEHFDGSRRELRAIAELLAKLHRELADCPLDGELAALSRFEPYPFDPARVEALHARARQGREGFDRRAAALLERIGANADAPPAALEACPRQLGHFDLNPHNVLFSGPEGALVGLLDLDLAHVSERARDVAIALHKCGRVFGERTERRLDCGSSLVERARLFLRTYRAANPLADEEVRAIPFLAHDEARRRIVYILERHYHDRNPASNFDLAKQETQMAEALALAEMLEEARS